MKPRAILPITIASRRDASGIGVPGMVVAAKPVNRTGHGPH